MIIDGREIAGDILDATRKRVASLPRELIVRAIVMRPTAATESYLRIKSARAKDAGMQLELVQMPDDASTDDVITAVQAPGADAVIVQLPLPETIDTQKVVNAIPIEKDADVLSQTSYDHFVAGDAGALLPPVVDAVREVLERAQVNVAGKRAVVIGNGKLVGMPGSVWLKSQGAEVTVLERETFIADALRDADVILSGAGSPHLITPDMLKDGVVLIDAGTSESNGALAGDVAPECAQKASIFTPVPGGIGPIAVACLYLNVAALAQNAAKLAEAQHLRNSQNSVH